MRHIPDVPDLKGVKVRGAVCAELLRLPGEKESNDWIDIGQPPMFPLWYRPGAQSGPLSPHTRVVYVHRCVTHPGTHLWENVHHSAHHDRHTQGERATLCASLPINHGRTGHTLRIVALLTTGRTGHTLRIVTLTHGRTGHTLRVHTAYTSGCGIPRCVYGHIPQGVVYPGGYMPPYIHQGVVYPYVPPLSPVSLLVSTPAPSPCNPGITGE